MNIKFASILGLAPLFTLMIACSASPDATPEAGESEQASSSGYCDGFRIAGNYCNDRWDENQCLNVAGCNWGDRWYNQPQFGGICRGIVQYACKDFGESQCNAQTACSWRSAPTPPPTVTPPPVTPPPVVRAAPSAPDNVDFVKPGNNGTVSCNTFCAGANWGEEGKCVGAVRTDSGRRQWCDESVGQLSNAQLSCECVRPVTKHGNNGTVSCDTFCKGSQWGAVGACFSSVRSDNGTKVGCSQSDSSVGSAELTCACVAPVLKHGNNGTMACRAFCARTKTGTMSGECVGAVRADTAERLTCDSVPGFLSGPELTCECAP